MSSILQILLVGLLLAWSGWRVLHQLIPTTMRNVQNRLAQRATRQGWTRLGEWLQSGESGAGCGDGCSTCGSCATPVEPVDVEQPVRLKGELGKQEREAP